MTVSGPSDEVGAMFSASAWVPAAELQEDREPNRARRNMVRGSPAELGARKRAAGPGMGRPGRGRQGSLPYTPAGFGGGKRGPPPPGVGPRGGGRGGVF